MNGLSSDFGLLRALPDAENIIFAKLLLELEFGRVAEASPASANRSFVGVLGGHWRILVEILLLLLVRIARESPAVSSIHLASVVISETTFQRVLTRALVHVVIIVAPIDVRLLQVLVPFLVSIVSTVPVNVL